MTMNDAMTKLKALADETRVRILLCLRGQALCLDHLTRVFGLASSTLSAHLKALADAGLVVFTREGHWRYYHLPRNGRDEAGDELFAWLEHHLEDARIVTDDLTRCSVALAESAAPVPSFLKPKVLFMCTGNSCRSQMAEALLRARASDRFDIYSAGLSPRPIPDLTFAVMDEIGVDLRKQTPKNVTTYLGHLSFEYLITVCPDAEARCPVFPGVRNRLCWNLDDPAAADGTCEERLAVFRGTRDELIERIDTWLGALNTQGKPCPKKSTPKGDAR